MYSKIVLSSWCKTWQFVNINAVEKFKRWMLTFDINKVSPLSIDFYLSCRSNKTTKPPIIASLQMVLSLDNFINIKRVSGLSLCRHFLRSMFETKVQSTSFECAASPLHPVWNKPMDVVGSKSVCESYELSLNPKLATARVHVFLTISKTSNQTSQIFTPFNTMLQHMFSHSEKALALYQIFYEHYCLQHTCTACKNILLTAVWGL